MRTCKDLFDDGLAGPLPHPATQRAYPELGGRVGGRAGQAPKMGPMAHFQTVLKTTAWTLILGLWLASPVVAGDFTTALDAFKRGDVLSALEDFHVLADRGNARAQLKLGLVYAKGQGVPRDLAQAHMWFALAADQGLAPASQNLDLLSLWLTPEQRAEAERLTTEWRAAR